MLSSILPTYPRKPRLIIEDDENGKSYAIIRLYMLPPFMAIIRDKAALLGCIGLLIWSIIYGLSGGFVLVGDWFPLILLPTLTYWPLLIAFEHLLTRRKTVIITQNEIRFRAGFTRICKDRKLPHSFDHKQHRLAGLEKNFFSTRERSDRANRKAKFRKHYFQQSYVIRFLHTGIPHDIGVIFEEKRAELCLASLNSAEEQIEGTTGFGKGYAIESEQEWRSQSGGLPENPRQYH